MKKVEAFVRHEAFEPIRMELLDKGFPSLSISEYKGSGRQKGITERYRGSEMTIHLRPKLKLEIDKQGGLGNKNLELPEAHIRGDVNTPYRCIGGAIYTMQRAGFPRVGFISEPAPGGNSRL